MERSFGKIYCIINKVNGKEYVGKTTISLNKRFSQHCHERFRSSNRPLYRAMNKYGIENFSIILLENCDIEKLAEREQYWIELKKTHYDGYNATLGGDGKILFDYEEIISLYNQNYTTSEIKEIIGCSIDTVRIALKSANIDLKEKSHLKLKKQVKAIFQNGQEIVFDSCRNAAEWLKTTNKTTAKDVSGIITNIGRVANKKRNSYLNIKWEWKD